MNFLKSLWRDERGQDLIEYALLLCFVCLSAAIIFIQVGDQLAGIFATTNDVASSANAKAALALGS